MFTRLHRSVDAVLMKVELVAALGAGCAAVAAMTLVSLDAVLRHAFGAPLTFQLHFTQFYLLVALVLLALPWGYRTGGAIQIRLLLDHLPRGVGSLLVRAGLLASAGYLAALAWRGYDIFHEALVKNEVVMGVVDWPVAWSWLWVPLGCGLLALRLVLDGISPDLRAVGGAHD